MWSQTLHLCVHPDAGPAHGRDAHLALGDDLHVGARGLQPQLAQVALEHAVHVHRLLPLPLGHLHVQLGLLGDVQRDVLLGGRARRHAGGLQVRLALEHLDVQGPRAREQHQRGLLAAVLAEAQARDDLLVPQRVQQVLVPVQAHLPVGQRHQQRRDHPRLLDGEDLHVGDGGGHRQSVVLLPLLQEAVHRLGHGGHVHQLVDERQRHRLRLNLDGLAQHHGRLGAQVPALHRVHAAVAAGHHDAPLHVEQPGHAHHRRHALQGDPGDDGAARGVQHQHLPRLRAHHQAAHRVLRVAVLLQGLHAGDDRLLGERGPTLRAHVLLPLRVVLEGEQVHAAGREPRAVVPRLRQRLRRRRRRHPLPLQLVPRVQLELVDLKRGHGELEVGLHVPVDEHVRAGSHRDRRRAGQVLVGVEGGDGRGRVQQVGLGEHGRAPVDPQPLARVAHHQLRVPVAEQVHQPHAALRCFQPNHWVMPRVQPRRGS
mmetsp:Transcript_22697/g.35898  ORF Transcript_22697/g.35898 Transcript_22697/m.35898 type:complete len:483 (-) Transcript_22697:91-1539(-)